MRDSRHLGLLSRQRRGARGRRAIVAAAQEERFTRKKHDRAFPQNAIAYCLDEARLPAGRARPRRVLRQAVPEVRTAAGDLSGLRAARLLARSAWRCRCGSRRSCSRRPAAPRAASAIDHGSTGEIACCSPNITCRHAASGVLSFAVRGGGGADDGRRRRMGDDLAGDRGRQHAGDAQGNPLSRIRSGCSIRPSPTTPDSRSIPANTR